MKISILCKCKSEKHFSGFPLVALQTEVFNEILMIDNHLEF